MAFATTKINRAYVAYVRLDLDPSDENRSRYVAARRALEPEPGYVPWELREHRKNVEAYIARKMARQLGESPLVEVN